MATAKEVDQVRNRVEKLREQIAREQVNSSVGREEADNEVVLAALQGEEERLKAELAAHKEANKPKYLREQVKEQAAAAHDAALDQTTDAPASTAVTEEA